MQNTQTTTLRMVTAALIAAAYTAISVCMLPLAFGPVQVRISEALTLLTVFNPVAIWGVTLGCALTNAIGFATGANILGAFDILFGTVATLLAALLSWKWRNVRICGLPVLSSLPPVILNAVIIGGELTFLTYLSSGGIVWQMFLINAVQVAVGQFFSCCVLGLLLVWVFERSHLDRMLASDRL